MTLPPSPIATAADYADAMLIARRVKNWMTLLLVVMLAIQLALFFLVRSGKFTRNNDGGIVAIPAAPAEAATRPAAADFGELSRAEPATAAIPPATQQVLQYLTGLIDFLGVILALVLLGAMLLILVIMLIGRLIGVSHVTVAFIGCLFLLALLFPWQAFLDSAGLTYAQADFKIPGVLYTWGELANRANFATVPLDQRVVLSWARFVGFPLVAIILLFWIHGRSSRGLRLALGEADISAPDHPLPPDAT